MTLNEAVETFREEPTQLSAIALAYEVCAYHEDGMIETSTMENFYKEISEAGFSIYR